MLNVLGNILGPYSGLISKFAGVVTCLQFLSGFFLLWDIKKVGSSDKFPPEPFLGGIVLTVLTLKMGSLMGDHAMINVNIIGFAINVVLIVAFYCYASGPYKNKIWRKMGIAGAFICATFGYMYLEDPTKLEFRLGLLITGILLLLVGSPMLSLPSIMRNKSTEGLPFPLILSGTVVAGSWMLYGISIKNSTIAYQNLLLFTLSFVQLSLFAIYPNTPVDASHQRLVNDASTNAGSNSTFVGPSTTTLRNRTVGQRSGANAKQR